MGVAVGAVVTTMTRGVGVGVGAIVPTGVTLGVSAPQARRIIRNPTSAGTNFILISQIKLIARHVGPSGVP